MQNASPAIVQYHNGKPLRQPGSKVHPEYERYKAAKTTSGARALEASRSMIKCDNKKGYVVMQDQSAVVVMALDSEQLVDSFVCRKKRARKGGRASWACGIRYNATDDLSNSSTAQGALCEINPWNSTHLHRSTACMPSTALQRVNLKKAKRETKERTIKNRLTFLEYVRTFGHIEDAVIPRSGSHSLE